MKKFWKTIEVQKESSKNFYILLDKKKLKTPFKNELRLPNQIIANDKMYLVPSISPELIDENDFDFHVSHASCSVRHAWGRPHGSSALYHRILIN